MFESSGSPDLPVSGGKLHFVDQFNRESNPQPQPLRKKIIEFPADSRLSHGLGKRIFSSPNISSRGLGWSHFDAESTEEWKISRKIRPEPKSLTGPETLFVSSGKRILNIARQRSSAETSLDSALSCSRRLDPNLVRENPENRAGGRPIRNKKLEQIEYSKDFFKLGGSCVSGMDSKVGKSILNFEEKNLKEKLLREKLWKSVKKNPTKEKLTGDQRNKSIQYEIVLAKKEKMKEIEEVLLLPEEVKIQKIEKFNENLPPTMFIQANNNNNKNNNNGLTNRNSSREYSNRSSRPGSSK